MAKVAELKREALPEGVTWEEPPACRRGSGLRGIWINRLTPLMSQPGRWARVRAWQRRESAYTAARNLRDRKVRMPDGEWEFAGRAIPEGGALYARYLGPETVSKKAE